MADDRARTTGADPLNELLVMLRILDHDGALELCYNVGPESDGPLDAAVRAWCRAGYPMARPVLRELTPSAPPPPDEVPSPLPALQGVQRDIGRLTARVSAVEHTLQGWLGLLQADIPSGMEGQVAALEQRAQALERQRDVLRQELIRSDAKVTALRTLLVDADALLMIEMPCGEHGELADAWDAWRTRMRTATAAKVPNGE